MITRSAAKREREEHKSPESGGLRRSQRIREKKKLLSTPRKSRPKPKPKPIARRKKKKKQKKQKKKTQRQPQRKHKLKEPVNGGKKRKVEYLEEGVVDLVDSDSEEENVAMDEEEDEEGSYEEEEEEDDVIQPVTDGREIIFEARALNKYLSCKMCNGYYRDAHTINTCLHTFCRSCLEPYFATYTNTATQPQCPQCGKLLDPNPMKNVVRPDATMQSITDKVFPRTLHKGKSTRKDQTHSSSTTGTKPIRQTFRPKPMNLPARNITFELKYMPREGESEDKVFQTLPKPFIKAAYNFSVKHLKKYLMLKLKLDGEDTIDITCCDESLGDEYNLEFIRKTRWHDAQADLVLGFRRKNRV